MMSRGKNSVDRSNSYIGETCGYPSLRERSVSETISFSKDGSL